MTQTFSRRRALQLSAGGFGYLALAALAGQARQAQASPLAPKQPHHAPRVKRVIFMFMEGGPSHVDTFDYKPALFAADGQSLPYQQPGAGFSGNQNDKLFKPITEFHRHGESGLWISDFFPHLARHADDLCLINSLHHDTGNHEPGCQLMHTGEFRLTRPALGAWAVYGLGAETENLPAYMSVNPRDRNIPIGCYSSGFLPAVYDATVMQGFTLSSGKGGEAPPIRNVRNGRLTAAEQRRQLDFVQAMNRDLASRRGGDSEIDAVIESYERGFRMQAAVPEVMDFSGESQATLEMYGLTGKGIGLFAPQCLLARRLAEAGVRFIEISASGWDHHGDIAKQLPNSCRNIDQPIAGLITDLKQRGMWEETLLVWGGEFGRTPVMENSNSGKAGRDHNGAGFTYWIAGGGVKGGMRYGATDELGYFAAEDKCGVRDLHCTILHLMGIDPKQLAFHYSGRDYTPADVDGEVLQAVLA